jgi:hypothetical protein
MVHYFVLLREILGDDTLNPIDPTAAIETIVNIFCEGVLADDFKAGSVS